MLGWILQKIIGTKNERDLKKLKPLVEEINAWEEKIGPLTDNQLSAKTTEFRQRYQAGESLDVLLPEAFAVVREAAKRTVNMRHFNVQLMGGIVLYQGKIAEMKTGEGKTLVATLPVYLNSISGHTTHIVTVNDYLAKRDSEWMGPIYKFLGLSVGVIQHDIENPQRQAAYRSDVCYVTNNEVGFDYLRDNMAIHKEDRVLGELNYAIVDEVDSILVDEARTPLIISGLAEESTDKYYIINQIISYLKGRFVTEKEEIEAKYQGFNLGKGYDYIIDEKNHTATLTEEGVAKCERLLKVPNLYDDVQSEWAHHINQALRAHNLFKKDVDYVVKDGEVIIVDEFTGRLMPGRRWSEGLHQAIEAKEAVKIENENQTLATITFQNLFRLYKKLAGMTGTAATERGEFYQIYKLDVMEIPTNRSLIRTNYPDVIYKTEKEKYNAIVNDIESSYKKGQPVLVGTRSIEKNEKLSALLKRKGVPHNVLNAKYHEQEAHIIAQAGRKSAVTIATNMAGRGTDILLGGNPEYIAKEKMKQWGTDWNLIVLASEFTPTDNPQILATRDQYRKLVKEMRQQTDKEHDEVVGLGGLYVLGTERHEARRIDNQLRGRSGRQGDPGSNRFYLSLEDELLRLFGSDRISFVMDKLGLEEGQDIQHLLITRAIENAQRKIEGINFDIRKQLLEYDNVMNKQREVIYEQRRLVLEGENLKEHIMEMINDMVIDKLDTYAPANQYPEKWEMDTLLTWFNSAYGIKIELPKDKLLKFKQEDLNELLLKEIEKNYAEREQAIGAEKMHNLERWITLQVIDNCWKDHLYDIDQLRKGIHLRAYGQKDPLVEYQHEAFNLFSIMVERIKEEVGEYIFKISPAPVSASRRIGVSTTAGPVVKFAPSEVTSSMMPEKPKKIGRNDPCPCGAKHPDGRPKKYKHCCGK